MLMALRYLTYNPGASNREIAAAISISDQAQVSRLMSRLSELGLTRSAVATPGRRRAWHLTHAGRREAGIEDRAA